MAAFLATSFLLYFLLSLCLAVSMKKMWMLLQWLQVVAYIPSYAVNTPPNVASLYKFFKAVIFYTWLPSNWLVRPLINTTEMGSDLGETVYVTLDNMKVRT